MKTYTTDNKPLMEEREVIINIHQDTDTSEWIAEIDTNIRKYANRCIKMGWEQVSETVHKDGTWISSTFKAPASAVLLRNANSKKRILTEEEKQALKERFNSHQNKQ